MTSDKCHIDIALEIFFVHRKKNNSQIPNIEIENRFYYMLWSKIDYRIFFSQKYISSHCCPVKKIGNRSRGFNARFTTTYRTVTVYRVLQMRGGGYADVLPVLQVPDNKADAVPCERLRK